MVERQRREGERRAAMRPDERLPFLVPHDHPLQRRQPRHHVAHLRAQVEPLAAIPVAVGGDEHTRLDLTEPIEHALHAEIR